MCTERFLPAWTPRRRRHSPTSPPSARSAAAGWEGRPDISVDEAVERFLLEHLSGEKGREESTVAHYRSVHGKWFSPEIRRRRLRDIDEATIDRIPGRFSWAARRRAAR